MKSNAPEDKEIYCIRGGKLGDIHNKVAAGTKGVFTIGFSISLPDITKCAEIVSENSYSEANDNLSEARTALGMSEDGERFLSEGTGSDNL